MAIVPIPLQNCSSVIEYFRKGGKVEVPRPERCMEDGCGLREPLRKNGSYARQVIYWGLCFLVEILRFRCRRCGKTASCPYGWLVPYRRFSAEVMSAGLEAYAGTEVSYRDLSTDLSDLELADPEMDIRGQELCQEIGGKSATNQTDEEESRRPAHTTIFHWVEFVCRRIETVLMQVQKELMQKAKREQELKQLPAESLVENPNSYKAGSAEKDSLLDRLSFATCTAELLFGKRNKQWYGLRAYFLTKAESRKDLLTETRLRLPITQSFELVIF